MEDENCYGEARSCSRDTEINWVDMPDKVHTYKLELTSAGRARLEAELLEAESHVEGQETKDEEENVCVIKNVAEDLHGYLLHSYSDTPPGPICPPIFVVHDPPPSPSPANATAAQAPERTQPIPEAHLYLSPAHRVGQGHHSVVYHGEWELPRTVFSPPSLPNPVLCKPCVEADINRILAEEDGEDGERRLGKWDEKCSVLKKVHEMVKPSVGVRFACEDCAGGENASTKVGEKVYMVDPGKRTCKIELEGPIRPIRTTVKWQDPCKPTCPHLLSLLPVPPTVKVGIVAKMSKRYDVHLEQEAENYQEFERHLSEHWSGWNFLRRTQKLVPLSAVVPQFYGYYVPEWEEDEDEEDEDEDDEDEDEDEESQVKSGDNRGEIVQPTKHGYFSPILLLENCGTEITHCNLTDDDKSVIILSCFHAHH